MAINMVKFDEKTIRQICKNVIESVADPLTIEGINQITYKEFDKIADNIGKAIGADYSVCIEYFDGEFFKTEYANMDIFDNEKHIFIYTSDWKFTDVKEYIKG